MNVKSLERRERRERGGRKKERKKGENFFIIVFSSLSLSPAASRDRFLSSPLVCIFIINFLSQSKI